MAIRSLLSDLRPFYRFSPRNRALQARARRRTMQLESLETRLQMAADVSTDQEDYAPGATALVSGTGYEIGEAIQLQVLHIDGTPNTGNGHDPWFVVDGGAGDLDGQADGNFQTTWYVDPDDSMGATFELTAMGLSSGLVAIDHFTDAADVNAWANQSSSWVSSVIQGSNSQYNEGATIPLQYVNTNLAAGSTHTVVIKYDFSDGGSKRFIDSLGSFNASEPVTQAQLISGFSGMPAPVSYTIPTDGTLPVGAQNAGSLSTYNISSLTFGSYSLSGNMKAITLTYVVAGASGTKNVVIGYGGHLASPSIWGAGNGAGYFPGASAKVYTRTDSESSDDQVSINPSAINSTPIANPDSYSTNEDTPLNVAAAGILANDTDGENSPLTAILVTGVSHGTLTLNSNGSFSYTPALNYNGIDTFTYKANDGASDSNVVTVTITVNPVNDAPVANPDSYSTNEDTPLNVAAAGVLGNDTDVDNNPLTSVLVTGVSHGTLTLNSNGSFGYTPALNFNGIDSFTYKANDGSADSNTVTVTITVGSTNDAPVANPDSYSTDEDTPLNVPAVGVLGNDSDTDNDPITSVLVSDVSHGTLTLNADGSFDYAPDLNFNGIDSFTYKANDGAADSNVVTVTITVDPVNDAPVANPDSYNTDEDTPLNVPAVGVLGNDSDTDNDPLTSVLVSDVSHGTLTLNADGSFDYTPDLDFNGIDSFTYKANDGTSDSNIVTVTITVDPVNDAPVANPDSYSTDEDTPLNVTAVGVLGNDSDTDNDPLTSVLVSDVSHGTLTLNADGSFDYTPDLNFNGIDSFTYKANDGTADSNIVTVTITVDPVNDAPVANPDSYSTDEDTPLNVLAVGVLGNDSDTDNDPLTSVLVSDVSHGTLTLNADGSFDYTPDLNFNGIDSFTYKANDGSADSNIVTVTISVDSVNDAPVANPDSYSTDEDTQLNVLAVGVLGNDSDTDNDPLTSVLVSDVSHGTLTLNADGSFDYMPDLNFNGVDSFTYKANDGTTDSNVVTVTITVDSTNDAPVANPDSYSTNEDMPLNVPAVGVLGNDSDTDNDPLTSVLVSDVSHGSLTLNADGSFDYTPDTDFNGIDSFTYKANDGSADSNIVTVTISVDSVNDAPVANPDSYSTDEDTQLNVLAVGVLGNDSDTDNDPLTSVLVSDVSHGTLTLNADGSFDYMPDLNFNGVDSFTYKANDGTTDSNVVTVTITVNPINDAPVANPDSYSTDEDTPLNVPAVGVLGNDSDTDNDPLTSVLVSDVSHGSLTLNADGSFDYTPDLNFNGVDSFTYKANDGTADSNIVTVTITVKSINDAPIANPDSYSTDEDTQLNVLAVGVLGNDSDTDNDPLTSVLVTDVSHGTLTLNADGSFDYTPDLDFNGVDSFTYKANDGSADSNVVTVTITVDPVNDAPIANPDSYSTDEDTPLNVPATGVMGNDGDVDGDPLTATLVTGVSHGTLVLHSDGSFEYTPDANYNGADSFTYKLNDGALDSNVTTVSIGVNAVNDNPLAAKDTYTMAEDTVLVIPAPGVLANDTDLDGDSLTVTGVVTPPAYGTVTIAANGSFTYTPAPNFNGLDSFVYQVSDGHGGFATAKVKITVTPVFDLMDYLVVAADAGSQSKPYVKVYDVVSGSSPVLITKILAYESTYRDGVRIAVGDVTGDNIPEIITAPGRLHTPEVRVFNFFTGAELPAFRTLAYDKTFNKGMTVAVGDVSGDGLNDIITSPTLGTTDIKVFKNIYTGTGDAIKDAPFRSFRAFPASFIGGATVAAADMNGDGRAEVIVGSGVGMRPTVLVVNAYSSNYTPIKTFLPLKEDLRGGIYVYAARVNSDSTPDLVIASGPSGKSRVDVINGVTGGLLHTFRAYTDTTTNSPVRAALRDINNDGIIDFIYTGQGPDGRTRAIRRFNLTSPTPIGVDALLETDVNFTGGLFLG